jgi:hypothetical protein
MGRYAARPRLEGVSIGIHRPWTLSIGEPRLDVGKESYEEETRGGGELPPIPSPPCQRTRIWQGGEGTSAPHFLIAQLVVR